MHFENKTNARLVRFKIGHWLVRWCFVCGLYTFILFFLIPPPSPAHPPLKVGATGRKWWNICRVNELWSKRSEASFQGHIFVR